MRAAMIFGLGLGACTTDPVPGDPTEDPVLEEELDEAREAVLALIGDASCDDEADCATVAFGDKPCGGPVTYLAYCTAGVDEAELLEAAEAYRQLEEEYNLENELEKTKLSIAMMEQKFTKIILHYG